MKEVDGRDFSRFSINLADQFNYLKWITINLVDYLVADNQVKLLWRGGQNRTREELIGGGQVKKEKEVDLIFQLFSW